MLTSVGALLCDQTESEDQGRQSRLFFPGGLGNLLIAAPSNTTAAAASTAAPTTALVAESTTAAPTTTTAAPTTTTAAPTTTTAAPTSELDGVPTKLKNATGLYLRA